MHTNIEDEELVFDVGDEVGAGRGVVAAVEEDLAAGGEDEGSAGLNHGQSRKREKQQMEKVNGEERR